jgi:hypothetical protein
MRALRLAFLILAVSLPLLAQSTGVPASQAPNQPAPSPEALKHPEIDSSKFVVPAETTIPLVLKNTINTRTVHVGQAIYCETIFPITVSNHIVIPTGSSIKGAVTQVVRPGRVKGRAQIGLRFETLILPNGTTRSLRATLSGFGTTGDEELNQKEAKIKGAGTKGADAGKVAQSTVRGAEIGTIVGAVKGSPGKGLGMGSLAGAAGGLIWVLASRGKEVVLPSGTNLELQLSAPLIFERDEVEPPSPYDRAPALPPRQYGPAS